MQTRTAIVRRRFASSRLQCGAVTAPPLVVGVDARAAAEVPGGRGRYVRELLRALAGLEEARHTRFVLYGRTAWEEPALDERFSWRLIAAPDPAWHLVAAARAS